MVRPFPSRMPSMESMCSLLRRKCRTRHDSHLRSITKGPLDHGLQQFPERRGVEWLGDELIAASGSRVELGDASADRGDGHDGDMPCVVVALQPADRFESADKWKPKVNDDHIRSQHGGHHDGVLAAWDRLDEPTGRSHTPRIEPASIFVVVHDEESGSGVRSGARWPMRSGALIAVSLAGPGPRR